MLLLLLPPRVAVGIVGERECEWLSQNPPASTVILKRVFVVFFVCVCC